MSHRSVPKETTRFFRKRDSTSIRETPTRLNLHYTIDDHCETALTQDNGSITFDVRYRAPLKLRRHVSWIVCQRRGQDKQHPYFHEFTTVYIAWYTYGKARLNNVNDSSLKLPSTTTAINSFGLFSRKLLPAYQHFWEIFSSLKCKSRVIRETKSKPGTNEWFSIITSRSCQILPSWRRRKPSRIKRTRIRDCHQSKDSAVCGRALHCCWSNRTPANLYYSARMPSTYIYCIHSQRRRI